MHLELKRRTNNKKIDALYNRMGAMMTALRPLVDEDQQVDPEKLKPLLEKIGVNFLVRILVYLPIPTFSLVRMISANAAMC